MGDDRFTGRVLQSGHMDGGESLGIVSSVVASEKLGGEK